jgi:hypothetical protein
MKKRLIPFVLILMLSIPITAGAEEIHTDVAPQQINVTTQQNEPEILKAYRATDNGLQEISLDEYNKITNEAETLESAKIGLLESMPLFNSEINSKFKSNDLVTPRDAYTTTVYKYNQAGYVYNVARPYLNKRISAIVQNETDQSVTRTITYTASQSFTANLSINIPLKIAAINVGITGGASWQNTYGSTDAVAQVITKGYYAWMDYYPIMNNSFGDLNTKVYANAQGTSVLVSDTNEFYDIYIAKQMSGGLPDGVYTVKQSTTRPNY